MWLGLIYEDSWLYIINVESSQTSSYSVTLKKALYCPFDELIGRIKTNAKCI